MNNPHIIVIDYDIGNTYSVISALEYLGCTVTLTNETKAIKSAKLLILPGVGSFHEAMLSIQEKNIDIAIIEAVKKNNAKLLGICLGMQLLGTFSTEDGITKGLDLIPIEVEKFSHIELGNNKLPHIGYNSIICNEYSGLFKDIYGQPFFYFNHSYRMPVKVNVGRYATCSYGIDFLAAFESKNICGCQFHPEKSQNSGLVFLRNFIRE